ncbi:hypothetical protein H7Y63_03265 [Polaromonas sp.]|nr:hypothetical protein [Candidatus Saccharibacteria bacterium]
MATAVIANKKWHLDHLLYAFVVAAAIALIGINYALAYARHTANTTPINQFLLNLSFIVPEVIIWFIAARAAKHFKKYAIGIKNSLDGKSLNQIANGLLLLVIYLVLLGFGGPLESLFVNAFFIRPLVALVNHLPLLLVLGASILLYSGSKKLVTLTDSSWLSKRNLLVLLLPYTVCMVLFSVMFYKQAPYLLTPEGIPRYTLSHSLLIFTYVIPHITVWLLGLITVVNLGWYASRVEGSIYRSLFGDACKGMILIFISIFFAQLLLISPLVVDNFNIGIILIYAVLILGLIGFGLLYKGASKLQKIEELR